MRKTIVLIGGALVSLCLSAPTDAGCAWVLWHASFDMEEWKHSVLGAYETKTECELHGQQLIEMIAPAGKANGKSVFYEKQRVVISYTCLPDTIDPRGK